MPIKRHRNGYMLILLTISIPVLLLGIKICIDNNIFNTLQLKIVKSNGNIYKKCAKKAALAVAQNWNPGVSYNQQKPAILKVADAIYNCSPAYQDSNTLSRAIPGMKFATDTSVYQNGKMFDPLKVDILNSVNFSPNSKTIEYIDSTKYYVLRKAYPSQGLDWNLPYTAWRILDKLASLTSTSLSKFDELDTNELVNRNFVLNHAERGAFKDEVRQGILFRNIFWSTRWEKVTNI